MYKAVYANAKKVKSDAYIGIDPCPLHLRQTTQSELNYFACKLHSFSVQPNWAAAIKIHYEEYDVDNDRMAVLHHLRKAFLSNLEELTKLYFSDPLSNCHSVHITGTEDQSSSEKWFSERKFGITA